ncbi:MAG: diaminopimelate epimerase [Acidimicrobiales bacterium]
MTSSLTLTKHHGIGNDFLVAVDPAVPVTPAEAVAWCHRHRGVGADGVITVVPDRDGDAAGAGETPGWTMVLWNADGSRAELSGNGLRCLGQALHEATGRTHHLIHTDAGDRLVVVEPTVWPDDPTTRSVTVDLGSARPGPEPYPGFDALGLAVERQVGVDIGNPHLVAMVGPVDPVDLAKVGPVVEASYPEGINLEIIEVADRGRIDLRVWERGVGITEACGTGASAAAWAAHRWGLVDERVVVRMPGGEVGVELAAPGGAGALVRLSGPATRIATVEIGRR